MDSSNTMILQAPPTSGAFQAIDGFGTVLYLNGDGSAFFGNPGFGYGVTFGASNTWNVLATTVSEEDLSTSTMGLDGSGGGGFTFSSGSSITSDDSGNLTATSVGDANITSTSGNVNLNPVAGGVVGLPVQAPGNTPTCGSAGQTTYTSAFVLCVCNGASWVHASTGLTACTF
jgi:hypothetical protein